MAGVWVCSLPGEGGWERPALLELELNLLRTQARR